MTTSFELRLRKALKNIEALKTPSCLEVETIGFYIDGRLSKGEKKRVEEHIGSCLYCLNQLLELKELIYFQKQSASVASVLLRKILDLCPKRERPKKDFFRNVLSLLIQGLADFIAFPFRQWRYATVSVVTASIVILFTLILLSPKNGFFRIPNLNPNSFVQVDAISSEGKILRGAKGVIIDPKGLVATNLHPLVGASLIQITLRDGKTYQVRSIWKDEEKNLALMKIEGELLHSLPIADLKQIHIGQRIFIVADPSESNKVGGMGLISDFKFYPGRRTGGEIQYIQLASFTTQYTKGIMIDQQGRLIGLLISEEREINWAAPIMEASTLIEEQRPIPIGELKNINFSSEALNYYFKGILARDARKDDEAMGFFKKAIELNPNLEGPHLELGNIYYKKRLYDLEIKEYEEVLRLNPKNTDALFFLAESYETKGLYDLAIQKYEKIITLDPEDAEAYYNLGLAYLTKGQREKALGFYPKLKELDPGFAEKLKRLSK